MREVRRVSSHSTEWAALRGTATSSSRKMCGNCGASYSRIPTEKVSYSVADPCNFGTDPDPLTNGSGCGSGSCIFSST